jgi:hypothetical protein
VSAPPFVLNYSQEAAQLVDKMATSPQDAAKLKKIRKALRNLCQIGPSHPGLHSHKYESVPGPNGVALWESYVENKTPSAWRIWWVYGPRSDEITTVTIGPHP